jgi:PST family polysaccharide transporter
MGRLVDLLRHPITTNALALYGVQIAGTLLPLVTLPYLVRVLGASEFGIVVFVQSFSLLLALLVDFGFAMSGTRDVATRRDAPEALSATVAGVQGAKLALCGLGAVLSAMAWPLIPTFREAPELIAVGLALGVAQGLTPAWFFTGMERLRLFSLVDVGLRCLSVLGIVLLVRARDDGELVLLIYLVAATTSTASLTVLMYRNVRPRAPSPRATADALRRGAALFVSSSAVALYTTANVFVLGLLVPSAQVAFFATAEKVVRALVRVLGAVVGATYPRVTFLIGAGRDRRANQLAVVTLASMALLASLTTLALILLAPTIVTVLFGPDFGPAIELLRILALTLPLGMSAMTLAVMWLVPRERDRAITRVVLIAGPLNVALLLSTVPALGIEAAAWTLVVVEAFTLIGYAFVIRAAGIHGARRPSGITAR